MRQSRLYSAFLIASSVVLSGCQTMHKVDQETCNQWREDEVGIPNAIELFKAKHSAFSNDECFAGKKLGYSALIARQQDGRLHPVSLVMWHNQYSDLMNKITTLQPEEAAKYSQIKNFADYFIQEGSLKFGKSIVTSPMAKAMYDKKSIDPTNFAPDGTYTEPEKKAPTEEKKLCKGSELIRICDTRNPAP